MAAADFAPLPIALLRLVVLPDELLTFGHGDGLGLPQRERVDRAGGPAPAVRAMAVTRADGVTRHDEPDRTTEAPPLERLLVLTHHVPRLVPFAPAIRARYRLARTSTSRIRPTRACPSGELLESPAEDAAVGRHVRTLAQSIALRQEPAAAGAREEDVDT